MIRKFHAGDRIRWFRYSHDMIVIDGGCGTIIDIEECTNQIYAANFPYYVILKDGGGIDCFPEHDMDLLEWKEFNNEN